MNADAVRKVAARPGIDRPRRVTKKERAAIRMLQLLAKTWPTSLWLFSASGTLFVMKKDRYRRKALIATGGVDQKFSVETISIENDGGDW